MKVVAFNGSPRENGNTQKAINIVLEELSAREIEVESVRIGGNLLYGCQNCGYCGKAKDGKCAMPDKMNEFIEKALNADGIILGSPVYFGNVTAEMKAFIDRLGKVGRSTGKLEHKIGASVVTARRAGSNFTYAAMNYLFGICEMVTVNSNYWNTAIMSVPGELEKDSESDITFRKLGANMAELLKTLL